MGDELPLSSLELALRTGLDVFEADPWREVVLPPLPVNFYRENLMKAIANDLDKSGDGPWASEKEQRGSPEEEGSEDEVEHAVADANDEAMSPPKGSNEVTEWTPSGSIPAPAVLYALLNTGPGASTNDFNFATKEDVVRLAKGVESLSGKMLRGLDMMSTTINALPRLIQAMGSTGKAPKHRTRRFTAVHPYGTQLRKSGSRANQKPSESTTAGVDAT